MTKFYQRRDISLESINFHPRKLAILRDQEEECERLVGTLYTKGLTQKQVGEVFGDIYGEHYSKVSIFRMQDYLRRDVSEWLGSVSSFWEADERHQICRSRI